MQVRYEGGGGWGARAAALLRHAAYQETPRPPQPPPPFTLCPHVCPSPVREVEGLLHAVAVVHVDVDVQHARVVLEQLQDGQHQVVDVAEARGLPLLSVVQPTRPVDCDVAQVVVELDCAFNGSSRVKLAEPACVGRR